MYTKEIQELDELKDLSKPLVEYLQKKYHPHAAIVITYDRAVLWEEIMGTPFDVPD